MESVLVAINNKATAGIVEKKEMVKFELREELRKELVTREMFDGQRKEINEKFNVVNERFNVVDEKFISLETKMNERFNVVDEKFISLERVMNERFKSVNERFNTVDEKFISLEKVMDERFKSLNFKLNLFLAIALIALTFANPAFVELIKRAF